MFCFGCSTLLCLVLSSVSGLILPMKKPSGEPDMDSVISHMTLMEQTITSLQNQVQASSSELTTVNSKLQTAEQSIAALQTQVQTSNTELTTVKDRLLTAEQSITGLLTQVQTSTTELTTVKANLQMTQEELKASRSEVAALEDELKLSETDIAILKHDLQKLPDPVEVAQLKTEFGALKFSQNISEHEVAGCKALAQSTAADLKTVQTDVNTISVAVNGLDRDLKIVENQTASSPEIYFRAHVSTDETIGNGTVKFDIVELNEGNSYSPTTGLFTAPVSGLYQFMFHVESEAPGVSSYYLVNEGNYEMHTTIHHDYDAASFTVIIHVAKGHHVSVSKPYDTGNARMVFSTQFSGYLLRKDS